MLCANLKALERGGVHQWGAAAFTMGSFRADLGLGRSNTSALLGSQGKIESTALIPHLRGACVATGTETNGICWTLKQQSEEMRRQWA